MDLQRFQAEQWLTVRRLFGRWVGRYEICAAEPDGSERDLVAFAQQKFLTTRVQVAVYSADTTQHRVFGFGERHAHPWEVGTSYDVTDATGALIGDFWGQFAWSLRPSAWQLVQPRLGAVTGHERHVPMAILRSLLGLSWLLPYQFDFFLDGQPAFSVARRWGMRRKCLVDIAHPQLDRRLVIAMAVALEESQHRTGNPGGG